MRNVTHKLLATVVAIGAIQAAYADQPGNPHNSLALVCDTVDEFALADGRLHNHNDEPVAGCHDVPYKQLRIVETDLDGGSYAIPAKVRYGKHVGFGDQAFIQMALSQHAGR